MKIATMQPLIINLAPTGLISLNKISDQVPLQPKQIIKDIDIAASQGITGVHLHAIDIDNHSSYKKEIYAEIIGGIREKHPELIICVSCSGRFFTHFDQRSDVLQLEGDFKPDMASLTLSSLNFTRSVSQNSPETIERLALYMKDRKIKPELEIFSLGMANYAKYLLEKNILEPPLYANLFFGGIATAQATLTEIAAIIQSLPSSTIWSVAGLGNCQFDMAALGVGFAHGVRIGLEDNLWLDKERAQYATNNQLVARVLQMVDAVGRPIMTPAQLRKLLGI